MSPLLQNQFRVWQLQTLPPVTTDQVGHVQCLYVDKCEVTKSRITVTPGTLHSKVCTQSTPRPHHRQYRMFYSGSLTDTFHPTPTHIIGHQHILSDTKIYHQMLPDINTCHQISLDTNTCHQLPSHTIGSIRDHQTSTDTTVYQRHTCAEGHTAALTEKSPPKFLEFWHFKSYGSRTPGSPVGSNGSPQTFQDRPPSTLAFTAAPTGRPVVPWRKRG